MACTMALPGWGWEKWDGPGAHDTAPLPATHPASAKTGGRLWRRQQGLHCTGQGGGGGSKDVESNVSVVCVLRIVDLRLSLLRRNEIVTVSLLHVDGTRWVKFT